MGSTFHMLQLFTTLYVSIVFCAGKSLDKIMELKERAGNQDLYDVMKKRKRKRKTQPANTQQPAKRKPKSVFDFINRKLGKTKGMRTTQRSQR